MIADTVGRLLGRTDCVLAPEDTPRDPLNFVVADAERLRGLGWRPVVSIAEGLRKLAENLLRKPVAPLGT
jgi:nucleoside-diphosphate-sugar epimerase